MLALSVREAIRDAIAAFGPPGGEVALAVPATCEAIFMAIRRRGKAGLAKRENPAPEAALSHANTVGDLNAPHPDPLPVGWGEGVEGRTG